jgi:UDP-glucose 4-epimerase
MTPGTDVQGHTHVVDLAKGHLCLVDGCQNHRGVEGVNLGTGNGCSVLKVVKGSGQKIKNQIVGRREGDRDAGFADASKATALFGREAKSDINQMCAEIWMFSEQNRRGL